MSKLLNVYITTYNRADMLKKAIKSVINQTYTDFNFFILDNASTDNTIDVINEFNNSSINYIRHKTNIGGLENIKFAFNHCDNEYILVLHDDDIICENMIEEELKILQNNKYIVAVSCNAYFINENDEIKGIYKYDNTNEYLINVDNYFKKYIESGKTLIFPSTMYNNLFLKNNNIYINNSVGPCADVIFHADIERTGAKLAIINKELIQYRHHKKQDSAINSFYMNLKLYNFLLHDNYYSKIFLNMTLEQKKLYKLFSKYIIKNYILNYLDYNTASEYISEISKCLYHKKIDKIYVSLILKILNTFTFIKVLLRNIYKYIRRNK